MCFLSYNITVSKYLGMHLCLSFPRRHREAWADFLDEFRIYLQVLQWVPCKRRRGGRGDLQLCYHTQWLPQKQAPRFVENHQQWLETRGDLGRAQRLKCRKGPLIFFLIFSLFLCNLLPDFLPHCFPRVSFLPPSPSWLCTGIAFLL